MSDRYTLPLSDPRADLALAGGKGASLARLVRAGLPVPAGFHITTAAYRAFVEENGLQTRILEALQAADPDQPATLETASVKIGALFAAGCMPAAVSAAIEATYASLGDQPFPVPDESRRDDLTGHILPPPGESRSDSPKQPAAPVAVRSSATAEDLPDLSFAGQHETLLNVRGAEAVLDAVKRCWASLWTARAISYRLPHGIDPAAVSMAVVVQQLVPADRAGILFTANPVDGARDRAVINAAWGLGEAVVSGQVTPDTLIVDRTSLRILSRETATKTVMSVATDDRTEEQPVPQAQQDQMVLDDTAAIELARYGVQIEEQYGLPVDVEWAIAGGEIAILQARPITGLPPAPLIPALPAGVRWDPPRPGTVWMRRQVVEHMPEPLSPLFDELYVREGLYHSMETLAAFLSDLSGFEIDLGAFVQPPFAATVNGYAYSIASFDLSPKVIPLALRLYVTVLPKMLRHLVPRWRDESLPRYRDLIAEWRGVDLDDAPDAELLRGIRELALEDAIYWFAAAVPLGLARMSDAALDHFLRSVSGGEPLTSGALLRGLPSKAVEAQAELEAIARKTGRSETLRALILETPAPRLLPALVRHPEGHGIVDDLGRYLDAYGHQVYNLDFAAPTLADEPLPVLLSLKTAVAHPERDALAQHSRLAREREALAACVERSLNPIQRPIFRRLLDWAQRYAPCREEALFYVGAAWPSLRRLALELGRRLSEAGSLHKPDDIFFLKCTELAAAISARAKGSGRPELAKRARERRALREAQKRLEPPDSVPPDGRLMFGPIDMSIFNPKRPVPSFGPVLEGTAVSPGRVAAPASVINSPEEFDRMVPDSILVCPTTTPAWTPLLPRSKGLVTDIGGSLAQQRAQPGQPQAVVPVLDDHRITSQRQPVGADLQFVRCRLQYPLT